VCSVECDALKGVLNASSGSLFDEILTHSLSLSHTHTAHSTLHIEFLDFDSDSGKLVFLHSAAHGVYVCMYVYAYASATYCMHVCITHTLSAGRCHGESVSRKPTCLDRRAFLSGPLACVPLRRGIWGWRCDDQHACAGATDRCHAGNDGYLCVCVCVCVFAVCLCLIYISV
jgi:hypothetical protein